MKRYKNYFKWFFLVGINVIVSFLMALDFVKTPQGALGVIAGILSFIFLYIKLEFYLQQYGKEYWRKSLYIAVFLFAFSQFVPVMHMITGAISLEFTARIFNVAINSSVMLNFIILYLTTIIDGILLSAIIGILVLLIRFYFYLREDSLHYIKQQKRVNNDD